MLVRASLLYFQKPRPRCTITPTAPAGETKGLSWYISWLVYVSDGEESGRTAQLCLVVCNPLSCTSRASGSVAIEWLSFGRHLAQQSLAVMQEGAAGSRMQQGATTPWIFPLCFVPAGSRRPCAAILHGASRHLLPGYDTLFRPLLLFCLLPILSLSLSTIDRRFEWTPCRD